MKVGGYYTHCCVLDLTRVTSGDDLDLLAQKVEDLEALYWDTLEEAMTELAPDMNDPDVAKVIHALQEGA